MNGHSKIGPSKAEQWIACPGSIGLSAKCPPQGPNVYGAAGTVYHTLSEELVTGKIDDLELMAKIGTIVVQEGFEIEITDEGVDGVMLYRDTIEEQVDDLVRIGKKATIHKHAEVRVDLKSIDPDLWGTADYLLFQKGYKLVVTDAKFGKGLVEVKENKQLGLYAIGAMETLAGDAFDEVWLCVVQPLAGHSEGPVRYWRAPKEWLEGLRREAYAAVQETRSPNARIVPGDHCKWCPVKKAGCPALYKAAQESAGADFEVVGPAEARVKAGDLGGIPDVRLMSMEKLALAYSWREAVESFFSSVADRIQETLAGGGSVPGYKLVDGRSNRKWVDEEKVVEEWQPLLPEGALFEHKLLSPAKLEKLPGVGKGRIDHLTFKPEAKKAIARDTDPRPKSASKAQDDFGVVPYPKGPGVEFDLDGELLGAAPASKRDPMWPL